MMGTIDCTYETPCGWCTKWDKECDKKMYTKSYRINHLKPITPAKDTSITLVNKMCVDELDHEWECCGIFTGGSQYRCKKCGAHKTETYPSNPCDITVSI